jgi:hypothetical protein
MWKIRWVDDERAISWGCRFNKFRVIMQGSKGFPILVKRSTIEDAGSCRQCCDPFFAILCNLHLGVRAYVQVSRSAHPPTGC